MQGVKIRGRRVDVRADRPSVATAKTEVVAVEVATVEDRVPLGV
jgi:hypothetical protein